MKKGHQIWGFKHFSTSFYFLKSLNFLKFFFEILYSILQTNVNEKLPVNGTYQDNLCTCQICQDISCTCCGYHMLISFFCDLNFLHGCQISMFKFCEDYYLHSLISQYFNNYYKKIANLKDVQIKVLIRYQYHYHHHHHY